MSAKPYRKPYVQPASNDEGIGQGRLRPAKQITASEFFWCVIGGLCIWFVLSAAITV